MEVVRTSEELDLLTFCTLRKGFWSWYTKATPPLGRSSKGATAEVLRRPKTRPTRPLAADAAALSDCIDASALQAVCGALAQRRRRRRLT